MTPRVVFSATFSPIYERTVPGARHFVTRARHTLQGCLLLLLNRVFARWHFFPPIQSARRRNHPAQFHEVGRESSLERIAPAADRTLNLERLAE